MAVAIVPVPERCKAVALQAKKDACDALKEALEIGEVTVEQVAKRIGASPQYVKSIIEGKEDRMTIGFIAAFMEACGCDLYFWVTGRADDDEDK